MTSLCIRIVLSVGGYHISLSKCLQRCNFQSEQCDVGKYQPRWGPIQNNRSNRPFESYFLGSGYFPSGVFLITACVEQRSIPGVATSLVSVFLYCYLGAVPQFFHLFLTNPEEEDIGWALHCRKMAPWSHRPRWSGGGSCLTILPYSSELLEEQRKVDVAEKGRCWIY